MWTWYVTVNREGLSDREAEAKAREMMPQATLIVVAKKSVFAYAQAEINDAVAGVVAQNEHLTTGSVRLCWLEPWMERDMRKSIEFNQDRGDEMREAMHATFHKMTGGECPKPN